jgi:ketosteroid isomerase-like protein
VTEDDRVALARRAWDAFNSRDFPVLLEYMHPDVEWRPAQGPGGLEGTTYHGREAYEQWLKEELFAVWEEFHAEELEFRELPDGRIMLLGMIVGKGRASGIEVRVPFGQLAEYSGDKVIRVIGYPDHATTLEAADLPA